MFLRIPGGPPVMCQDESEVFHVRVCDRVSGQVLVCPSPLMSVPPHVREASVSFRNVVRT